MDTEEEEQEQGGGSPLRLGKIKTENDDRVTIPKARRNKKRLSDESEFQPRAKAPRLTELSQQRSSRGRTPAHPFENLLTSNFSVRPDTEPLESHIYEIDADTRTTAERKIDKHQQAEVQKAFQRFQGAQELDDRKYKIDLCTTPLTVWQFVSADQMIKREKVRQLPFGGALFSGMGVSCIHSREYTIVSATDWSRWAKL